MVTKLEKESLQLVKKLNEDIERARRERAMKVALSGKLAEMRKKLKDMEAKRRKWYREYAAMLQLVLLYPFI